MSQRPIDPEAEGFIDSIPAETARYVSAAKKIDLTCGGLLLQDSRELLRGDAGGEITPVLSPGQTERPNDLLGKTVLHGPSGVVGSVRRIYGPGEYLVKPKGVETSGRPVSESVVELEDGNAFLFRSGAFTVLEAPELRLWKLAGLAVREAAENIVGAGAAFRVTPETTTAILKAALSAQLRTLSLD